ncbi:MAG: uridine kinase [Thiolinea sp.]
MSVTPFFLGICGGSGSGKSSLARAIMQALPEGSASLIALDAYYHRRSHFPAAIQGNFDHPDSLEASLLAEHLRQLAAGRPVTIPCYDFTVHDRRPETRLLQPTPLIILDGILLFALEPVLALLDRSVFVDVPADIRLARRLRRDVRERGRTLDDVLDQYLNTVRPMHEAYVEVFKDKADVLVSGMEEMDAEVAAVLRSLPPGLLTALPE